MFGWNKNKDKKDKDEGSSKPAPAPVSTAPQAHPAAAANAANATASATPPAAPASSNPPSAASAAKSSTTTTADSDASESSLLSTYASNIAKPGSQKRVGNSHSGSVTNIAAPEPTHQAVTPQSAGSTENIAAAAATTAPTNLSVSTSQLSGPRGPSPVNDPPSGGSSLQIVAPALSASTSALNSSTPSPTPHVDSPTRRTSLAALSVHSTSSSSTMPSSSSSASATPRSSSKQNIGTIGRLFGKQMKGGVGSDDAVHLPDASNETQALEQKLFSIALFIGANSDAKNELTAYKDRHWTEYMAKANIENMSKKEKKQQEVIWELFVSELSYIDHLLIMKEIFLTALRELQEDGYCREIDEQRLFFNIEELLKVNSAFASQMRPSDNKKLETTEGPITITKMAGAFAKYHEKFEPYNAYCVHYAKSVEYLRTLEEDPKFDMLRKWCEQRPRCRKLKLTDILVEPLQRIIRYPLLLREVAKATSEEPENLAAVNAIIDNVSVFVGNINKLVRYGENTEKVAALQSKIEWPVFPEDVPDVPQLKDVLTERLVPDLTAGERLMLHSGKLMRWSSSKSPSEVEVFLFQDMLLITRFKKKRYVVSAPPIHVDSVIVKEIPEGAGGLKSAFSLIVVDPVGVPTQVYTLIADGESGRKLWLSHLFSVVSPKLNNSEAIASAIAEAEKQQSQPAV
ncbi:hypothetical protein CAOG_03402 [Capsaspora owczarzaki ATCC 30864]|uniref:DH domain-containing protein n=1 Tax=Capsaspora owczarzaki (strain ATCC 30864) TaxID=595528 RepID=A0A0D2WN20_CAPO3|nr:hypothetical protein CAOG_03402 [Capsaspora owczarzaki ATCC 30864]KJE92425.1 hypothetical protein CAOG_003402 [Capsaspora owczarzaki ATCC 30864]|eukprot:XP_004364241.1 hypothetical protein CAOG_03402 [Capsaspora owczarzaki ATCC 30864]